MCVCVCVCMYVCVCVCRPHLCSRRKFLQTQLFLHPFLFAIVHSWEHHASAPCPCPLSFLSSSSPPPRVRDGIAAHTPVYVSVYVYEYVSVYSFLSSCSCCQAYDIAPAVFSFLPSSGSAPPHTLSHSRTHARRERQRGTDKRQH